MNDPTNLTNTKMNQVSEDYQIQFLQFLEKNVSISFFKLLKHYLKGINDEGATALINMIAKFKFKTPIFLKDVSNMKIFLKYCNTYTCFLFKKSNKLVISIFNNTKTRKKYSRL